MCFIDSRLKEAQDRHKYLGDIRAASLDKLIAVIDKYEDREQTQLQLAQTELKSLETKRVEDRVKLETASKNHEDVKLVVDGRMELLNTTKNEQQLALRKSRYSLTHMNDA